MKTVYGAQKGPTEEAEEEAEETDEGRSLRLLSGGVQTDAVYGALVALGARTSAAPRPRACYATCGARTVELVAMK